MSALEPTVAAPAPNAAPQPIAWRRKLRNFGVRLAIYGVIYTLSIGPMFWWWYEAAFLDGNRWIAAFYYPLLWACDHVAWFGDLVNRYINLWIA